MPNKGEINMDAITKGTKVRVIYGDYKGVEGIVQKSLKHKHIENTRKLVVEVESFPPCVLTHEGAWIERGITSNNVEVVE